MRTLVGFLALAFVVCGCSTTSSVATKQGRGTQQVYRAPFDQVWRAAVDAAQIGDLEILNASRDKGYISAKRSVQAETFGENVGVWVTRVSPTETQVEVVSRQAGPPVFWLKNWENEIHRAIQANLTREAVGSSGAASTAGGEVSGASGSTSATAVSTREEMRRDAQRRIDDLRRQEQQREDALAAEESLERRNEIQTEIERLRSERRTLEDYLLDLEVEGPPR